ncbi:hypothetical protein Syun_017764 [Stephania yunnanensis]|uniref:Uncharacterized protein n=1 Tax=Stephania yunnanensis TaxID=152371 RepID=A0AAP0J759_9MAGN
MLSRIRADLSFAWPLVAFGFSLTEFRDSITRAKKWVQELQKQGNPNMVMALVGNKEDLEDKRKETTELFQIGGGRRREGRRGMRESTTWEPPSMGWVKLNSDGVVRQDDSIAGAGGLARDDKGSFMWGFSVNIGKCLLLTAKLWGSFLASS